MKPESLASLVSGGNASTLEEEWLRAFEVPDVPAGELIEYSQVLTALCEANRSKEAETLAWAAVEAVSSRMERDDTLKIAGAFLLAIKNSEELRSQVTELFLSVHSGREGLEGLIEEAGIGGGRPVRRALRTLNVCLAVGEGDFLLSRDEEPPARIDSIDTSSWTYTVTIGNDSEQVGAVHLADRFQPASATHALVMRQFAPEELRQRVTKAPAEVIIDMCREHRGVLELEELREMLVPDVLEQADWKRWWTRARTALKKIPNVAVEGRSPDFTIKYDDKPVSFEQLFIDELNNTREPLAKFATVEKYLRDCKARKEEASQSVLQDCVADFVQRARAATNNSECLYHLMARWAGEIASVADAGSGAVGYFRATKDLPALIESIPSEALLEAACDTIAETYPEDWQAKLLSLLTTLPTPTCEYAAAKLLSAGAKLEDFHSAVHDTLADPARYFGALAWLWDGPSRESDVHSTPLLTIFTRMLHALEQCRKDDKLTKETARNVSARARAVVSARKFERLNKLIDEIEPRMAAALKTQVARLDNLGIAVYDDVLKLLGEKAPEAEKKADLPMWAQEDVLYVTKEAFEAKRAEIDHHINVKMKENAKAIGDAAAHGDLSENSEFKFALEERDLLRARLAQMNSEFTMATTITSAQVPTDYVGVGSTVELRRNTDGSTKKLSFGSSWDSDTTAGCLNYKAPMAQEIMGKRIGETVDLDFGDGNSTYEIVTLGNAIEDS